MPEAVIVATARSPIGRAFKGSLKEMRPDDLTVQMVRAALGKVPQLDPAEIDDLMLGCGLPGGEQGYNMARVVAVLLGLDNVPGTTVTRYCSSSLQTTRMAFHAIKAGEGDVFISAGVECVSRFVKGSSDSLPDTQNPLFGQARARTAELAKGGTDWHDPREDGELPDIYIEMGQTAENVARLRGVTRKEQDEFGVRSQNLAEKAIANGFWETDITPVTLPDGTVVSKDDGPRPGTTYEKVAALQPVFRPDGTVTAGNCCPLNDGAAALVIMSDVKAAQLGITPLARIVATGVSALSPESHGASARWRRAGGRSPGPACRSRTSTWWRSTRRSPPTVIPSYQDLGIDLDRLNVNGGAIAVGHPFGMTGARITSTLINSLRFHDKTIGLETMCVGGGQGMAMILERLS